MFGSTVQLLPGEQWAAGISRVEAYDGHLGAVRIFQTVPNPSILAAVGSRMGVYSFDLPPADVLSGAYDAQFTAFFAAVPTDRPTWWSYFHEADVAYRQGRLTDLQQFRDAYTHVALLARAANNARLKNAVMLVGYTANPQSGLTVSQFMPRSDLVDAVGWDNYNGWFTRQGYYGDPAKMIERDRAAAASVGQPFAITEFGSVVLGDDTVGRADWVRQFSQDSAAAGALFAGYFDSDTYGRGADYRLLDAPSQQAMRDVLAGTPLTAPAAPGDVVATAGDGSLSVDWQTPDDHGSPVTGYTVTVTDPAGKTTSTAVAAGSNATTVGSLTDRQTYTVTVSASNAQGTGTASGPQSVDVGVPVGAPTPPTAPVALPDDDAATLTWTAPASNGGSSITGYAVTAVDDATGSSVTTSTGPDRRTATVTGLTNGRSYDLQVTAVNAAGSSAPAVAAPVTPFTGPAAPDLTDVAAGDSSLTATWTPPADTGGAPITGYVISALHWGVVQASATVPGEATTGTVSGLTNGTPYTLTVAALNGATGPASAPSAPTTPATVPTAPACTAGGGSLTDSVISATAWWKWPSSTGGSNITGFQVATYHYVNDALASTTLSAVQPWDAWQYQATGLIRKDRYRFSVQAINSAGASPWCTPTDAVTAY